MSFCTYCRDITCISWEQGDSRNHINELQLSEEFKEEIFFIFFHDVMFFFIKKKCKNKIWFSKQGFISGEKNILPNNNISLSPVSLYNENCLPFWRIVERLYPLWSILSLSITNSPFIYNIRSCFYLLLSRTKQCHKLLQVKEKIMSTSSLGIFMWFFKNIT